MKVPYLTEMARSQADWLSTRQMLITSNIANANTPGFKVQDLKPFEMPGSAFPGLVATHEGHRTASLGGVAGHSTGAGNHWETYYSGNNVSLPQESMKLGDVATDYELNTSVMRSFHRLVVSVFTM